MKGPVLSQMKQNDFFQFIKFALVGVSNTLVSYVIYIIVLMIMQALGILPDIDYLIAQWTGYVLSIVWAFILNRKFVFSNSTRPWFISLIRTFIAYSFTGLILSSALLYIEVDILGLSKIVSPLINIAICLPINYLMNKYWAFEP